jgi:hypothetical protein
MKNQIFAVLIAITFAACAPEQSQQAAPSIDEAKTREVLEHHLKAFQANDLEATMADYTEESIIVTPDATARGLTEIRKNFEGAFAAFPKDSMTFTLNKTIVLQDVAYILWQAKTPKFELSYATDSFIIQNGKIVRQTYAGAVKQ